MKQMLISVGTTKFENLIKAVDTPAFYELLDKNNFSKLIVQKGRGEYHINNHTKCDLKILKVEEHSLLDNFSDVVKASDYVVAHAGAGTILESFKQKTCLISVVNDTLMDNHQVEMAEALESDNYIYYVRDLAKLTEEVKNILESKKKLKEYPAFNEDAIPKLIYEMLDI